MIVVGDIHGCLEELKELLLLADFQQGRDTLVLVGDLVNKGPLSAEVRHFSSAGRQTFTQRSDLNF